MGLNPNGRFERIDVFGEKESYDKIKTILGPLLTEIVGIFRPENNLRES